MDSIHFRMRSWGSGHFVRGQKYPPEDNLQGLCDRTQRATVPQIIKLILPRNHYRCWGL